MITPHTVRVCKGYLQNAGINVMDWPAKSPNLSPIVVGTSWWQDKEEISPASYLKRVSHSPSAIEEGDPTGLHKKIVQVNAKKMHQVHSVLDGHIAY